MTADSTFSLNCEKNWMGVLRSKIKWEDEWEGLSEALQEKMISWSYGELAVTSHGFRYGRLRNDILQGYPLSCFLHWYTVTFSMHLCAFNIIQNMLIAKIKDNNQFVGLLNRMAPEFSCEIQQQNRILMYYKRVRLTGCRGHVWKYLNMFHGPYCQFDSLSLLKTLALLDAINHSYILHRKERSQLELEFVGQSARWCSTLVHNGFWRAMMFSSDSKTPSSIIREQNMFCSKPAEKSCPEIQTSSQ